MVIELTCLIIVSGCAWVRGAYRAQAVENTRKAIGQEPVIQAIVKNPEAVKMFLLEKEDATPTYLTNEERRWISEQPNGKALLLKMAIRDMVSR